LYRDKGNRRSLCRVFGKDPQYEQYAAWGPQIGATDPGGAIVLSNEVDSLGIDSNEGRWLIGWIMKCFEKKLLTIDDLDGLQMKWRNVEATRTLLKKIAYREGVGNLLADGIKAAAEKISGESIDMALFHRMVRAKVFLLVHISRIWSRITIN
jgi:aldehyde:ferredoxin oxidoreductase